MWCVVFIEEKLNEWRAEWGEKWRVPGARETSMYLTRGTKGGEVGRAYQGRWRGWARHRCAPGEGEDEGEGEGEGEG